MRSFLEQYGTAIFTLVIISILIAFAGPVGTIIKTNVNTQIQNVDEISSSETTIAARDLLEPKEAVDEVYCILYDDGELTISQTEITPDENRTVLNKGYFTRPKDVDTTEGKQHIITVRFVGGVKPKSCRTWFGEWIKDGNTSLINSCIHLTEIKNMENLYTNECTDMLRMFYHCESLTTLDVSNFDTSNVTDMSCMFEYCTSLTVLDVNNFDTSKVRSMSYMFAQCQSLTIFSVSKFDTSNVTNMKQMFYNCKSLTILDLSNFDTSNVTNMKQMFYNCKSLTALNLSNFDTSKVPDMSYMFGCCTSLATLDLSNFDTSNVTNMQYMFNYCPNLISITCPQSVKDKIISMGNTDIPSTVTWTIV